MKRFWSGLFAIVFLLIAPVPALADGGGDEHHEEELAEPLFTGKSFLESEIEVEAGFDDKETESETEIGLGASWVFLDRLQLGVELPSAFGIPTRETPSTASRTSSSQPNISCTKRRRTA